MEIHGTEGTLLYGSPDEVVRVRSNKLNRDEWVTIEMPARRTAAFDQWVEHIQNDTIAEENIGLAIDLTKLMEAANLSEAQKRQVKLSELAN